MAILLLLFSFFVKASDLSSERYCFTSDEKALQGLSRFSAIEVPSDLVNKDRNCLVIQMLPHRRELIQRYILSTDTNVTISFSSEALTTPPCNFNIIKVKNIIDDNKEMGISNFKIQTTTSDGNESIQIQTLRDFEISVDQDEIKGSCRYITPNRYEITLEVKKLPPAIALILPSKQEGLTLKTQLQLSRGDKIEIGEVIKNLREKDFDADLDPTLKIESKSQKRIEKVFLSFQ